MFLIHLTDKHNKSMVIYKKEKDEKANMIHEKAKSG